MLMSASETLLGVPRAFTIDSPNVRVPPAGPILGPFSVSAIDTVTRVAAPCSEVEGGCRDSHPIKQQGGGADCKPQQHHLTSSPFTLAPAEARAAFAGLCTTAQEQASATPASPYRTAAGPGMPLGAGMKGLHSASFTLTSTLSTFDSHAPCCTHGTVHGGEGASPMDIAGSSVPCRTANCSQWGPPHGAKAVCGKRSTMEDAFAVQTNFFDLPCEGPAGRVPSSLAAAATLGPESATPTPAGATASDLLNNALDAVMPPLHGGGVSPLGSPTSGDERTRMCVVQDPRGSGETLHFFGVYDGHGGCEAAHHCATRLHHHLFEALSQRALGATPHLVPLDGAASPTQCVGDTCQTACALIAPEQPATGPVPPVPPAAHATEAASPVVPSAVLDQDDDTMMSEGRSSAGYSGLFLARCRGSRLPLATPPGLAAEGGPESPPAGGHGHGIAVPMGPEAPGGAPEAAEAPGGAPELPRAGSGSGTAPFAADDARNCSSVGAGSSIGAGSSTLSAPPTTPTNSADPCSFPVAALREAFLKTDLEFAADASAAVVGSTAVVALLGRKKIWVANCGDSRAVLCQNGKAVQLTEDHKPERKDEAERVEKAGGHVLYWNGHRVMGILAMSRAIGDHGLRPYIIPDPEISVVTRTDEDDFLLLASDGLWDVMTNQEATDLATRCLTRAIEKGASRKAAVRISASVLTKAAIDRGSKDNVTVVMVDLKVKGPEDEPGRKSASGPEAPGGAGP